jgi:putative serine protease PepD
MTDQTPYPPQDSTQDLPQNDTHQLPLWTQPTPAVTPPKPKVRPSTAVVAGLLAAAVTVGGVAGVAGAAGLIALDENRDGTVAEATNSPVVSEDSDDSAAAGTVEQVAQAVLPSVVKINVMGQQGSGSGSGIIISSDGLILTNNHVVEVADGSGALTVNFNDGSSARATVVGTDPLTDLAVIKAEDVSGLSVAKLNTSDTLDVGEEVVAIGSPFGLEATVTSGIVSALNRPVSVGGDGAGTDTTYPAIQTDAAINPGNSGGALVNMSGEVVGINSSIRTASSAQGQAGGSIGLGFAIPLSKVMPIVDQLRNGDTATHARLGVTVGDAASDDGLVTGAEIQTVTEGSAADKAGIKSGDVVTKVGDTIITGSESLVATVRGMRPGDSVTITVVRGDDSHEVKATLDSDGGTPAS